MKWINGLTPYGKRQLELKKCDELNRKLSQWHNWFAWYPVVVGVTKDHHRIKAWLTTVQRKAIFISPWEIYWPIDYEYREMTAVTPKEQAKHLRQTGDTVKLSPYEQQAFDNLDEFTTSEEYEKMVKKHYEGDE